jgi:uncharacterized protein YjiK
MTARAIAAAALATCVGASACRQADAARAAAARADSSMLAQREARLEQSLVRRPPATDSTAERKPVARWVLPMGLDELSGIALTPDRRLLAHGDERGQISEIDYRRGVVTKQFVVGRPTLKGDFEGITIADGFVFLLESNGTLYEFREGANGERVDYTTHDTRLGKECEFEGVAFDSTLHSLLLACKTVGKKHLRDSVVIYRWRLDGRGNRLSMLTVPLSRILPSLGEKELHPSDIAVDPLTGNYVLVASIERAIVEITPAGDVVFARKLPGDHEQAESVAITPDSILIIGDEAKHHPAIITLYPWP